MLRYIARTSWDQSERTLRATTVDIPILQPTAHNNTKHKTVLRNYYTIFDKIDSQLFEGPCLCVKVLRQCNNFQPLNNIVLNIMGSDLLLITSLIFDQINLMHTFEGFLEGLPPLKTSFSLIGWN